MSLLANGCRTLTLAVVIALLPALAFAQYPTNVPPARVPAAKGTTAPAKPPAAASRPEGGQTESALRQRVDQLEEQLVDMQVTLGTVESLGKGGGAARGAAVSSFSGAEAGRLAALETQLQALTAQVEQLTEQVRAMRGGGVAPAAAAPSTYRSMGNAPAGGGFGTTTVTASNDPIGRMIAGPEAQPGVAAAPLPPMPSSAGAKQLYESAYGQLLQQNYPEAEAGFAEFLQRYPNDEMAANAQFWLGETFFVRGQWDAAASAFLKVAQSYGSSAKAPDSLAKLAMSFERKGNKPAACRALQELDARYPTPPAHVKTWAVAERRRAGCT